LRHRKTRGVTTAGGCLEKLKPLKDWFRKKKKTNTAQQANKRKEGRDMSAGRSIKFGRGSWGELGKIGVQ